MRSTYHFLFGIGNEEKKKKNKKKPTTCFNYAEGNEETGNFNCPWVQNREVVAGELGAWGPRQGK